MTDRPTELTPASVPKRARQAGATRGRWSWAAPTVWTERMLAALDAGVKRGQLPPSPPRGCSPSRSPCGGPSILFEVRPPTGEPCAGDPHARFGGRGGQATGLPYPYRTRGIRWPNGAQAFLRNKAICPTTSGGSRARGLGVPQDRLKAGLRTRGLRRLNGAQAFLRNKAISGRSLGIRQSL